MTTSNEFMSTPENEFDIAIIGMAGRFPGARNVDEYWQNLCDGKESITFFTDDELMAAGVSPQLIADPDYVKAAPILDEPGEFDAGFFGYSPREARTMDPQHRLFLQSAWHALEDAGYDPDTVDGPIGVYGGAAINTYFMFSGLASQFVDDYLPTLIGNDNSFLTTRVSYKLNLTGPSVTIQTACSTSLVAVHQASQSLLSGECNMALAGAAAIRVPHHAGHLFQEGSVFTPDGHCRAFDAQAQGVIFGSGVGMIVLKRLADAVQDEDHIYAVIKGSAINNDGSSKVDYTAPSVSAQADVISEALASAGVSATDISYVEAHGTGTYLGDPIEVAALTKAFRNDTNDAQFCALGSVKTNIGHLDAAAGIAGLIKTVLCLKHKTIPATLHYERPNPQINFAESPFYVNAALTTWDHHADARFAGISSLGIGGTNAHIILGEAPPATQSNTTEEQTVILPLSARTPKSVCEQASNLAEWLTHHPDVNLSSVAYTLCTGRKSFSHRATVVCRDIENAIQSLERISLERVGSATSPVDPNIAFMFPGQGSQHVEMGRQLYESQPIFRESIDRCTQILQNVAGMDICSILYPKNDDSIAADKLTNTYLAQPAIFVIEYAMAQLLLSWGIEPSVLIGHSVGEYAAACIAGVFSLDDALMLVASRGELMQQLPSGSMLAVTLSENEMRAYLTDEISIAALNNAQNCVVSGPENAVLLIAEKLESADISYRFLHTSHAFHSSMMEPILDSFKDLVDSVPRNTPTIPIISTVYDNIGGSVDFTSSDYWVRNLRDTVRFFDTLDYLETYSVRVLIEVGPGTALSTFAKQHTLINDGQLIVSTMRHPKQEIDDSVKLMDVVGALWQAGYSIEWEKIMDLSTAARIPLPGYAFDRTIYWPEIAHSVANNHIPSLHLQQHVAEWGDESLYYVPSWKRGRRQISAASLASTDAKADDETQWLVFENENSDIAATIAAIIDSPKNVIRVTVGNAFQQVADREFVVNIETLSSIQKLFDHAVPNLGCKLNILYCFAYGEYNVVDKTVNSTDNHRLNDYFFGLMNIARGLSEKAIDVDITLGIFSTGLHEVIGNEEIDSLKSLLLGPCRVLNKEYPDLSTFSIDFLLANDRTQYETDVAEVVNEMISDSTDEVIAYRHGYRWMPTFEVVDEREMKNSPTLSALRQEGVYLITGGFAGVGYEVAKHIALTYGSKLVIIGRSLIPKRSEWDTVLADLDATDATRERIERVLELEKLGATVLPLAADVTDAAQMEEVITDVESEFGLISGVFHAAGVANDGLIDLLDDEAMSAVLAPKVLGTQVLTALFVERVPEFIVLFSSINAFLAPAGQVAYSAANAFLDATAIAATKTFPQIISINWPGWDRIGMFGRLQSTEQKTDQIASVTAESGLEALTDILNWGLPRVIVYPKGGSDPIFNKSGLALPLATSAVNGSGPIDKQVFKLEQGADGLVPYIAKVWAELLGIEPPQPDDNFFELGGSSLIATQLFSNLSKAYGLQIQLRTIFDAQTPNELGNVLQSMLDEKMSAADAEQAEDGEQNLTSLDADALMKLL